MMGVAGLATSLQQDAGDHAVRLKVAAEPRRRLLVQSRKQMSGILISRIRDRQQEMRTQPRYQGSLGNSCSRTCSPNYNLKSCSCPIPNLQEQSHRRRRWLRCIHSSAIERNPCETPTLLRCHSLFLLFPCVVQQRARSGCIGR